MPWNNREVLAPNLESLALGGVLLNESYVQPICTPSRSAFLSGRYPFTIGRQVGCYKALVVSALSSFSYFLKYQDLGPSLYTETD